MNERIKELAEYAGIYTNKTSGELHGYQHSLERFAKLVRQDEREACAKLCEDINKTFGVGFIAVDNCAAAIRGRTE